MTGRIQSKKFSLIFILYLSLCSFLVFQRSFMKLQIFCTFVVGWNGFNRDMYSKLSCRGSHLLHLSNVTKPFLGLFIVFSIIWIMKYQAVLHPEQDRVLTIREFARLQGFPDFYALCGNVKERYVCLQILHFSFKVLSFWFSL